MILLHHLYAALVALARPLLVAASPFHAPLRRAVRGRAGSLARFRAWSSSSRGAARPLVWVHAPSVGEALMAQAVVGELRALRPDVQVAFTHFSPSAERVVGDVGADVSGYLPWDTRGQVRAALDALRPAALVFVRTEVWPVLALEAAARGVPLLLVNAVLSEESSRLTGPGRRFLGPVFGRLDAVGAVTREHGNRYRSLGVPPDRIHVTGDARFDQVLDRIDATGLRDLRAARTGAGPVPAGVRPPLAVVWPLLADPDAFTVVAGSTWPADEAVLVPAFAVLRRDLDLRLIIAPHEPTGAHLDGLERRLDRNGLSHVRLGALTAAAGGGRAAPEVVLVDRLGVLADLYAAADAAFVGGGFGTAGLHSVVEPAALGVPVLFGPTHGNAREAAALEAAGGGFVVRGAGDVEDRLAGLAGDPAAVAAAGDRARTFVEDGAGAAVRNAKLVAALLGARTGHDRPASG